MDKQSVVPPLSGRSGEGRAGRQVAARQTHDRGGRSAKPQRRRSPASRPEPGHLVLVTGAAGTGADTLIAAARTRFAGDRRLSFPLAYVTRPGEECATHVPVSRHQFRRLRETSALLLEWEAEGRSHGLPAAMADDLSGGRIVVVGLGGQAVAAARALWPRVTILELASGPQALRSRLVPLTRRAGRPAEPMRIDSSGGLGLAVGRLIALLERLRTT